VSINMTDSVSFSGCAVRNNVGDTNSVRNHIIVIANVRNFMLTTTSVSSNTVQQGMVFWIDNIDQTAITDSFFSNNA
jgi:hypothetical protein